MPQETIALTIEDGLSGDSDIIGVVEKSIGNMSERATVEELGGLLGNPKATSYVDSIGQKLASHTGRKDFGFKFDIIKNSIPNAFALPNGSIFVTDGLLRMLRSEAQLANVLGHEVAHVTRHHTIDQIKTNAAARFGVGAFSRLFSRILSGNTSAEDRKAANSLTFDLVTKGYSRKSESEADEVGQRIAARAGWDPRGMVDVMSIFAALEKDKRASGIEAYLRSHPNPEDRMKEAERRLSGLPRGKVGAIEYTNFLENVLGTPVSEAKLSPFEAAVKISSEITKGLTSQDGMKFDLDKDGGDILISSLIIGGSILAVIVIYLLLSRRR
jgi:predicted Zn-dependent protease